MDVYLELLMSHAIIASLLFVAMPYRFIFFKVITLGYALSTIQDLGMYALDSFVNLEPLIELFFWTGSIGFIIWIAYIVITSVLVYLYVKGNEIHINEDDAQHAYVLVRRPHDIISSLLSTAGFHAASVSVVVNGIHYHWSKEHGYLEEAHSVNEGEYTIFKIPVESTDYVQSLARDVLGTPYHHVNHNCVTSFKKIWELFGWELKKYHFIPAFFVLSFLIGYER